MGFRKKKHLGQHFLYDRNILRKIVELGDIRSSDQVWEIGPGMGTLTTEILSSDCNLTVFEVDKELFPILENKFGKRIHLIEGDVLRVDWSSYLSTEKIKIVANIPYQITSPLLYKITRNYDHFEKIVLLVQKELAHKLRAVPRTKDYGVLTLKVNFYFNIKYEFTVKRHLFKPVPMVDSAVISLIPRMDFPEVKNVELFWKTVETAFGTRRKTLKNNLKRLYPVEKLEKVDFDLSQRAEQLCEADYIELFHKLGKL